MRRISVIAAVLAVLAGLLGPATATARGARPDLVVTAGSAAYDGTRVVVTFSITNQGGRRAHPTTATVLADGVERASVPVGKLRRGQTRRLTTALALPPGTHPIEACADADAAARERREQNNCRPLGAVVVPAPDTTPHAPITFTPDTPFRLSTPAGAYWLRVPAGYDATHRTPYPLLVYNHGCGDNAASQMAGIDMWADASRFVVMVPELGRDGACWDLAADPARLRAAITDVRTHLNLDLGRNVIGGYSSGALLAGRVALTDATAWTGLLIMMGSAFYGDRASLLAGATARFPVAWRAHTDDATFTLAGVREDQQAMRDAGFSLTATETAGSHLYTPADLAWLIAQAP